jgi:hypothetical protein
MPEDMPDFAAIATELVEPLTDEEVKELEAIADDEEDTEALELMI